MQIKTLREFSGVPIGTTGIAEKDGNTWKITWDLTTDSSGRLRSKSLVDWFTQQEFNDFLEIM